jgi:hypothetical protein
LTLITNAFHERAWTSAPYFILLMFMLGITGCSGCQEKAPVKVESTSTSRSADSTSADAKAETEQGAEKPSPNDSSTDTTATQADSENKESSDGSGGTANSNATGSNGLQSEGARATGAKKNGAARGSSATGDGVGDASEETPKRGNRAANPAEALAIARGLQKQCDSAESKKEYGRAYQLAVKAWESVQEFPGDLACDKLGNQLEKKIDELGLQANAQNGGSLSPTKTLIVK